MRQDQFLEVVQPDVAHALWLGALDAERRVRRDVPLREALGRVLAEDVIATGDVPAFDRSNVDGYAVRAEDTFGASEREPVHLRVAGAGVDAGHAPEGEIGVGETRAVATGGMPPRGADAMVMVEDTEVEEDGRVRVMRPAAPGARIAAAGSDVARGETILRRGTRLTARETGTLAACGVVSVACVRRPRVAVISTGDEIVEPGRDLRPGQVHDANATLLTDAVRELGLVAVPLGIVQDDEPQLRLSIGQALEECDAVLLSGGTSKGGGDLSYRVVEELARVVVHGVALKPGKPLCLAEHEGRPVAVLPGFPTSAIFTFHTFVAPVLRRLHGEVETQPSSRRARLPWRVASERGRAEFTLVSLVGGRSGLLAVPMGKGSGSVTSFARADGFFEIPADTEYADEDEEVEVTLISPDVRPADLVVIGSHCTGLDVILGHLASRGLTAKVIHVGSRGGLAAAKRGACDVAPMHLFDPTTGSYNAPFVDAGTTLQVGYGRRQGLAYRPEHVERLGEDGDEHGVPEALSAAAADPSLRIANRNPASGTRQLIEHVLTDAQHRPPGWSTSYRTHNAVAAAVGQGRADYGVCLEGVARAAGLCWRALADERYDFLIPDDRWDAEGVVAFREALAREDVRAQLRERGFEA